MKTDKDYIDELLAYYPLVKERNPDKIATWPKTEIKENELVNFLVGPYYADEVIELFKLISQPYWCDYSYSPDTAGNMVYDDGFIKNASLDEIKTMLTYCHRGERFCSGHWEDMIIQGRLEKIFDRLVKIRQYEL